MELHTNRLLLRPWQERDVSDLVEGVNDYNVTKWLAFVPFPYTEADAQAWITVCSNSAYNPEHDAYEWAIELVSANKVIGGVGITNIDWEKKSAHGGGIWLNTKYAGHGYGHEAFAERARFAFEELGLEKIESGFFPGNVASQKMQEKIGYKIIGERKNAFVSHSDDLPRDEVITELTRESWKR